MDRIRIVCTTSKETLAFTGWLLNCQRSSSSDQFINMAGTDAKYTPGKHSPGITIL